VAGRIRASLQGTAKTIFQYNLDGCYCAA